MKSLRDFGWVVGVISFAIGRVCAMGDDGPSTGAGLTQVTFDRLIPTGYPTVPVNFGALRTTTFDRLVPTSYPAVHPDFGRLRQATFDHLIPTTPASPGERAVTLGTVLRVYARGGRTHSAAGEMRR